MAIGGGSLLRKIAITVASLQVVFFFFFFAALPMAFRNAEESRQIESHHIK